MTLSQIDTLLETLDAEADAIRSARYQALAVIQRSISAQMEQLGQMEHPASTLKPVKEKLLANGALLKAATGGMAAARARIDDLLQVQNGLSIYDPSGKLATVPTRRKNLEKKA